MLNLQQGVIARSTKYTCLIYGEPGIGKTTFALGATNPLYLDCEDGAQRVELRNLSTVATVNITSFNELLQITEEDIKPFDTIIIDTIGALIIKAQKYIMEQKKKQTFTIQDWGTLRTYVLSIFEKFKGKSIIIIAHTDVEKVGESERFIPQAQGSAINVLETSCDLIGYMYRNKTGQRIIDFTGQADAYWKNSFGFSPNIAVPEQGTGLNNAFQKIIEAKIKDYRAIEAKQAPLFNELYETFTAKINAVSTPEHCTMILKEINETEDVLNIRAKAKVMLNAKVIELGCVYDGVEQIFKKGE